MLKRFLIAIALLSAQPALADEWLIFKTVDGVIPDGAISSQIWVNTEEPIAGESMPADCKAIKRTTDETKSANNYKAVDGALVERTVEEMHPPETPGADTNTFFLACVADATVPSTSIPLLKVMADCYQSGESDTGDALWLRIKTDLTTDQITAVQSYADANKLTLPQE